MIDQEGGKVISSGGFGCIFSPSLKCQNELLYESKNKISKLMIKKYAEDEYKQIQQYKEWLKVIPNYENYFLLDDFELCKPIKLTAEDLQGYKNKCKSLNKKGITIENINNSLDKIMSINMPNGGIDIEKFAESYFDNSAVGNMIRLNNSLIDLLVNGIIPMNNLNIYHCDIKDGNVLVQITETGLITRLIDWGLSFTWDVSKKGIPRKMYRRPFQFNVPFSAVLFNTHFVELYNNFLELNQKPDYFQIREFVINYIFIWNDIRGPGHLSAINEITKNFTIKDLPAIKNNKIKLHLIEYEFTYYYIIEYLAKILEKYTNNGSIDLMSYFENVFLKNVDIWGFTMIYIVLYEYLYKSIDELNEYQMEFITKVKYIIIHFLYESPINPIDVSSLINELTSLNKIIEKFALNNSSKRLEYFQKLEENIGGFVKTKKTKQTKKAIRRKKRKTTKKRKY